MDTKVKPHETIYSDPKYQGKHVIQLDDQIFTAVSEKKIVRILRELKKTHPNRNPVVAYVPRTTILSI